MQHYQQGPPRFEGSGGGGWQDGRGEGYGWGRSDEYQGGGY